MLPYSIRGIAVATFVALSFATMSVRAAEPPGQNARDLRDSTCKDVMRLSGQDRDVALVRAHGYVLGKKGTTKYEIDNLAQITDNFIDYCLDNPKETALAAFAKVAK